MKERAKNSAQAAAGRGHRSRQKHLDDLLDQALADTFPASDPVALAQPASETVPDDDEKAPSRASRP